MFGLTRWSPFEDLFNFQREIDRMFDRWVGVQADYRTFFVHRAGEDPRVHRFTTGLAFFVR